MSEPNDDGIPALKVPETMSSNMTDLSRIDKTVLLPLFITGVMAAFIVGSSLFGLIAFALACGLMYRVTYGRVINVICQEVFLEPWIKFVQHELVWQATDKTRRLLRQTPALDLQVSNIGDWLGVIHNVADNTDVIVVTGTGSDIASKDIRAMHKRNLEIAEAIKKVASLPGFHIGASFLYRRRPTNVYETWGLYGDIVHPDITNAVLAETGSSEPQSPDGNLASLLSQLTQAEAEDDGDIEMATVWTITREPLVRQAARGKKPVALPPRRLIAMQVAEAARDNLEAVGVSDVTVLNYEGIERFLRQSWDVNNLDEWYVRSVLGVHDDDAPKVDSGNAPHWPQKVIRRGKNYCQLDDTFHSVLLFKKQPAEVVANLYFQLHSIPVPNISVSAPGEAFRITRQGFLLGRGIPIIEGFVEQAGVRLNPRQENKVESLRGQEQELYGSGMSQAYNITVGVTGASLDELEDNVAEVLRHIRLRHFDAIRVTGRCRQLPAMLSATTGIPML